MELVPGPELCLEPAILTYWLRFFILASCFFCSPIVIVLVVICRSILLLPNVSGSLELSVLCTFNSYCYHRPNRISCILPCLMSCFKASCLYIFLIGSPPLKNVHSVLDPPAPVQRLSIFSWHLWSPQSWRWRFDCSCSINYPSYVKSCMTCKTIVRAGNEDWHWVAVHHLSIYVYIIGASELRRARRFRIVVLVLHGIIGKQCEHHRSCKWHYWKSINTFNLQNLSDLTLSLVFCLNLKCL